LREVPTQQVADTGIVIHYSNAVGAGVGIGVQCGLREM